MKKAELCTTLELSKLFGITRSEVLKCVAEGMPIIKRNQYNFLDCFIWYGSKDRISAKEYSLRAKKINFDLIGKRMLQIERSHGTINPNRDNKGRLKTSPEAWRKLLIETEKIFKNIVSKK